jgi:hypothetical protein
MDTFVSSALGSPSEYRAWITDRFWIVMCAKDLLKRGGTLCCRPAASSQDWSHVMHTDSQCSQVMIDMDTAIQRTEH